MNLTAKEISELVKGELEGNPALRIDGVSPLESAGPSHLAYLAGLKKAGLIKDTKAGCLILPLEARGKELPFSGSRIYVSNPKWAFTLVLRQIQIERRPKVRWGIHPSAVVDPTSKIGKYASIGPYCVLEKDVVIGEFSVLKAHVYVGEKVAIGKNCLLYPQVTVRENCSLGDHVIVHSGAVIGSDGFGYVQVDSKHEKIPQLGTVIVEDDVEVGAGSTIDRATLGETKIGAGTKIDNQVQIAHNVSIGRGCIIVAQVGVAGSSSLGEGVVIAGQAGISDHVHIGSRAVVAGQSGVRSDVPDGSVVYGIPAKPRTEAFRLLTLYNKLPEIYQSLKEIKKRISPSGKKD